MSNIADVRKNMFLRDLTVLDYVFCTVTNEEKIYVQTVIDNFIKSFVEGT